MGAGGRAWLSATMLAGFLCVAGLQLAVVVVPVLLVLALLPGSVALRLGLPLCIATVGVMAYATWRALRSAPGRAGRRPGDPGGRAALWALVDAAAAAAGVRPPDAVIVVAEATAALSERTRLLGLIGGRRDLYLGLPLLQAWDDRPSAGGRRARARARLAAARPVGAGGVPRPGRRRPDRPADLPPQPGRPAAAGLRALYRRVDAPVSRAQELAADRIAAEFAGARPRPPRCCATGPRWRPATALLRRVSRPRLADRSRPGRRLRRLPAGAGRPRRRDRAVPRRASRPRRASWDTHPPLAERLAALTD